MGMGDAFGGNAMGLSALSQLLQGQQFSPSMKGMLGPDDRPMGSAGDMGASKMGMMSSNPYVVNTGSPNFGLGYSNAPTSGGSSGVFPLQGQYGIVKMAKGGIASAANKLERKGRNGDSMLVHMTPKEVSGLQAIARAHGGSLTINPDTGLVEAGFLKNILPSLLPMAAGAALTIGSGGALSPLAASMIVGGGYGLATGSVEKGLMAGLGAYGGAGMAGNLAGSGASAAAAEAQTAAEAANAANAGVIPQASTAGADVAQGGFQYNPAGEMVPSNYAPSITGATPTAVAPTSSAASLTPTEMATFTPDQQNTILAQRNAVVNAPGAQNIVQQPTGGLSSKQMLGNIKAGYANTSALDLVSNNAMPLAMSAAPAVAAALEPEPIQPVSDSDNYEPGEYKLKRLSADFRGSRPNPPNPAYRPTGLGYAEGGITGILMARGGMFDDSQGADEYVGMNEGGQPPKKKRATVTGASRMAAMDPYEAGLANLNNARAAANMAGDFTIPTRMTSLGELPMAAGGHLGGYSDGGRMLKGPGDGMSDSIPATISGKQPARLADGEFVVPADVVSHLGNGSTDAGAKKLYGMMDKIRMARTGKKKQAPAVKTDKYLPA